MIGGAQLFNRYVSNSLIGLYITEIHYEFAGDTYFPEFNESELDLISKEKGIKG